ncbi:MerR family DNA-binding transcriptional regulator [Acidipropionibacterium jensenii]|uniref:HEAT repeat domain-containing protein n=1 Tax=Acidipropionibacterium jensenii TaxID=1749 RepID=UPI000BC2EE17|nr:HEAT repeat domain-containing protein [Acidipropionibacterium jensenii]AZZ41592.1 MerR family DNA-binding transcriptional regulator [Acidipropionibacterium jensenii]
MLIGEVSRRSGVSVRMLRHYDRIGLMRPSGRTGTGYRRYEPDDLRRLFRVEALRTLGLSLEQVGRALDDPDFDAARMLSGLIDRTVRRIAEERELLSRLREIESSGPHSWTEALSAVDLLSRLRSGRSVERQAAALRSGITATAPDPLIGIYLSEPEEGVAGSLRWAIARSGEAAVPTLVAHLSDSETAVRRRVIHALGEIDGPAAADALVEGLADPDPATAGLAAILLASHSGPSGELSLPAISAPLVRLVVAGQDDVEAAEVLGRLASGSAAATGRITSELVDQLAVADPAGRSRIVQALGEIPGEGAAAILLELADDPDPEVSRVARYLSGSDATPS